MFDLYEAEGLHIENATNDVEPGIMRVYQMFETGQLKIMDDLYNTLSEIRVYRRDEKGKIVKKNDHLMDALRYICGSLDMFSLPPDEDFYRQTSTAIGGAGRDPITGY